VSSALLLATDLAVGYNRPVLGPLSFQVDRGDVLGVWGPGGAGKSALLRAIARGAVVFRGRIRRATGLSIAYQEQRPARLRNMPLTAREYLDLAGARAVPPAVIEVCLRRRLDALAGAQFHLLRAWAALGSDADLVLLDDPGHGLESTGQAQLTGMITRRAQGRGVIITTQDQDLLATVATRMLEVPRWS
jgi:ABC-type Mn2+/Zn2+ transport system ATPase subunit